MINRKNSFDDPVNDDMRTYDNIWKNSTGQWYDRTTDCLLDYNYLKK